MMGEETGVSQGLSQEKLSIYTKVSVVIPTVDRSETIGEAIKRIFAGTVQPFEIIVVDQSKNDLTCNALSKFIQSGKVRYLKDEGSGASRSRNIGWRNASGEIIAFTDDDAQVDSQWLETIQRTFSQTHLKIGVLGGKIIPSYEQKNANWSIPKKWEYLLPAYDQGDQLSLYQAENLPAGVNYSVYRSVLEKFSGFDESLGPNVSRGIQIYGEDAEFALRLQQNGFDIVYNPNCIVHHPVPLSRQTQNFLEKRLISEGATYVFMQTKTNSNLWECLVTLVKSLVRYSQWFLSRRRQNDRHYLTGKITALLKCGLLKRHPDSL
ncbi:glycosyltransferase family 2 protein [Phormidesmis sp. 146-35]